MPKRPPVIRPDQRPKTTRVVVAEGHHVYAGIGHLPVRSGEMIDLPEDHAAELIRLGHAETEDAHAARQEAAAADAKAEAPAE